MRIVLKLSICPRSITFDFCTSITKTLVIISGLRTSKPGCELNKINISAESGASDLYISQGLIYSPLQSIRILCLSTNNEVRSSCKDMTKGIVRLIGGKAGEGTKIYAKMVMDDQ